MYILSGTVITTPLVFKPMTRVQGTSPDYVPYSESVMGEIEDIKVLTDALTPSAYNNSGLTVTNGTLTAGGFCKVGNIVFLNIRVKATASDTMIYINGLPAYSNIANANIVPCTCKNFSDVKDAYAFIETSGRLAINSADVIADKSYAVSAIYLCN